MSKVEWYAERIEAILGRCDGGREYPWPDAVKDMNAVLRDIKRYRPRSRGNRLIQRHLVQEAKMWLSNWEPKGGTGA